MSGYLQRLASSARAPSAAIRPVLGSLFSASSYENAAATFQAVVETAIKPQPESFVTSAPQLRQRIQPAPESHPAGREASQVEPHSRASQAFAVSGSSDANFQTNEERVVRGEPEGSTLVSEAQTPFAPLIAEVRRGAHPALEINGQGGLLENSIEEVDLSLERPDRQATHRAPYAPFVTEGSGPTEAKVFRNSRALASDARRPLKMDWPGNEARPGREADEIQIHIGRIEVTAVPPAPARPAAQPVRKSLRLDEYLKRGRERAQ